MQQLTLSLDEPQKDDNSTDDTVICQSEAHGLPSEGDIMTFSYYHEKCFTFPTPYIEALARHGTVLYVEWPYGICGHRSEKTIHITSLGRIAQLPEWGRVACSSCGEYLS